MRDACIVAFTNCATSIFAAIIIFGIMGFKAHRFVDNCMEENQRLFNMSTMHGDAWALVEGTNLSLPVCDLQEQLDKSASGTGLAFILFTGATTYQG